MRQYFDAKRQYRDAIVFFRMGDFYEMFYEDALTAARALELTLTSRSKDASGGAIPMCGVPFHAADGYIARLVRKGFRVAVVEQVEDPKKAKGLVRREVVRVVSPGTLTDAGYLDAREPAFLLALAPAHPGPGFGAALLDVSTGEFTTAEYVGDDARTALRDELAVLRPREVLAPVGFEAAASILAEARLDARLTQAEPWTFEYESARRTLLAQLNAQSLQGYGLDDRPAAVSAAGALVQYLRDTQKADLAHVRDVSFRTGADCLLVDPITLKNLEVIEGAEGGRSGSLLHELDRTITPMGGRLLRGWLIRPLVALERIQDRLDAVEDFGFRATARLKLRETMKGIHDVERLVARAALGTAGPRDLVSLRQSIAAVPRVRLLLDEFQAPLVKSLTAGLDDLADVRDMLERTLLDEPPAVAREGGMIRDGVDAELDELRGISRGGKRRIAEMEEAERARTGIGSLKIRYNRVFGYYIEVSKSNLGSVPPDYHRKQTIAGGERFITPALKDYEEKVLGADERIVEREIEIFDALRGRVAAESPRVQDTARGLAALDVLAALAETASIQNYTKPLVHAGDEMVATDVRHPVVERHVADAFVPNDISLDAAAQQLVILDEIGRGTATFDGLSLAWAVAEHLASNPRARPKTIFATHYHELTDLADALPSVVNFHVVVREWKDDLVLLRKVVPGRADRSYGIQVARLAGLPPVVVARARDILAGLERDELSRGGRPSLSGSPSASSQQQLGLFAAQSAADDPLRRRLRDLDVNHLTPMQALTLLADLKHEVGE